MLREQIAELKGYLNDKNAPFGVDLLIPQVGGSARKTNYDYTKGKLNELVQIIIDSGAKLFVCAVGVPPPDVVKKLHDNGVLYMNMIGHPKHVQKAIDVGADIICAQGGEGGGHTGHVPTTYAIVISYDLPRFISLIFSIWQYLDPYSGSTVRQSQIAVHRRACTRYSSWRHV